MDSGPAKKIVKYLPRPREGKMADVRMLLVRRSPRWGDDPEDMASGIIRLLLSKPPLEFAVWGITTLVYA